MANVRNGHPTLWTLPFLGYNFNHMFSIYFLKYFSSSLKKMLFKKFWKLSRLTLIVKTSSIKLLFLLPGVSIKWTILYNFYVYVFLITGQKNWPYEIKFKRYLSGRSFLLRRKYWIHNYWNSSSAEFLWVAFQKHFPKLKRNICNRGQ